jgi:hypothetical protein
MPLVKREQILAQLEATCEPDEAESAFLQALALAELTDKRLYKPEEVSALGRGLMTRAQGILAASIGDVT